MSQLTQALNLILRIQEKFNTPAVINLNPGITRTEIENITKNWSIQLPNEIYELYQWRNGVGGGSKTCEPGGLFEIWAFEPLQNISIEKQPSSYEYPLDTSFYSLNIFFSYESCFKGYIVFNNKAETQWVELVDTVDGFCERMLQYTPFYYYTNLTSMILTVAESYEKAYFQDSQGNWNINKEIYKKIWYKYNSSKLSEFTLNQFIQNPSFTFINQLITKNITFLDPTTQEYLIQILQKIQLNTKDKSIKKTITRILGEGANKIPKEFYFSNLLKEYCKVKESSISSSQRLSLSIEEEFNPEQDIKQIDKKRREQSIKIATIFILFMLKAVDTLIQALGYDDMEIRREAAWALGDIGDSKAIDAISQLIKDEDLSVREAAQEALIKLANC